MLNLLVFLVMVCVGSGLALKKGPFYALLVYVLMYYTPLHAKYNWWLWSFPFTRWSMLASVVLVVSLITHSDKLVKRKWYCAKWLFFFLVVTVISIATTDVQSSDNYDYTYKLITYAITVFFIVKAIGTKEQLKVLLLMLISLTGYLGVKSLSIKRINGRLENIGTMDTIGSNQFGMLLGSIIPFTIPFFFFGKRYEKILCLLALPFLLNAMILCNSRGAFVAFAFSIISAFCFAGDAKLRKYMIIGVLCGLPLLLFLADPEFITRFSGLWKSGNAYESAEGTQALSSGRTAIWKHGLVMVGDYPLGAGPNGFKNLARFYLPEGLLSHHKGVEHGVRGAHNTYIQILVEQGIIGLLIWLIMCVHSILLLAKSTKILKRLGMIQTFLGFTIVAINMSLTVSMVGGMFGSRVYYEFFWWQIALAAVCYSLVLDLEKETTNKEHLSAKAVA